MALIEDTTKTITDLENQRLAAMVAADTLRRSTVFWPTTLATSTRPPR